MKKKIDIFILVTIVISLILFTVSLMQDTKQSKMILNKQLETLNNSIIDEYKKRLKESINHTITFIDSNYSHKLYFQNRIEKNLTNILNKENEKLFLRDVRSYLYNKIFEKSRYIWINKIDNFKGGDNYATRLIHPNLKETEGKKLSTKTKDIKGNLPYKVELDGINSKEEIFFTYFFKQLNSKETTEKLAYAKLYKRLNWVIATGIPINTLNEIIATQKKKLTSNYKKHLRKNVFIKIAIFLVFIVSLLFLRRKLHKLLKENSKLNKKLQKQLDMAQKSLNKFFDLPLNLLTIIKEDGTILEINSGWKILLGYDKKILNTNILNIIHPNDITKIKEELKRLKEEGEVHFLEIRLKTKKGHYKNFVWSANLTIGENIIYATAQDISELKEKTNLIYQQSKMASIGEMTANIAHQWRQPLSIISTASSGILVKKSLGDLDDKFLEDTLNQITNSTKYLSDTIEDFRNFYSPHKAKNYFTIEHITNKMLNLIKKRFENNDIKIITDIEEIELNTYENELLQVLINITNNARDQLVNCDIENRLIQLKAYEKDEKVYLEIIDNGGGIKEEIIQRVFEPYFTTKDKSIGTGIGLYMSEEIVTKHLKGEITVSNVTVKDENKTYTGARFCIKLDV